jgi:hypothetical protein
LAVVEQVGLKGEAKELPGTHLYLALLHRLAVVVAEVEEAQRLTIKMEITAVLAAAGLIHLRVALWRHQEMAAQAIRLL